MRHLVAALFIFSAVPALAQDATLTVSGTGQVAVAPDMAVLTMGAEAQAPTAAQALDDTSQAVSGLMDALTQAGVAAGDIQTSGLSVRPVWTRPQDGNTPPAIEAFAASNSVRISVRDLDALGDVIAAATKGGVNQLGGLSFDLQDRSDLEDQARRLAVEDARNKAGVLAEAAGAQLGALQSLREGGSTGGPMPVMRAVAESVPIAAGQIMVTAQVELVYAMTK